MTRDGDRTISGGQLLRYLGAAPEALIDTLNVAVFVLDFGSTYDDGMRSDALATVRLLLEVLQMAGFDQEAIQSRCEERGRLLAAQIRGEDHLDSEAPPQ